MANKTNLPWSIIIIIVIIIIIKIINFVQIIKWFHEKMVCLSLVALRRKQQQRPPSDPALKPRGKNTLKTNAVN